MVNKVYNHKMKISNDNNNFEDFCDLMIVIKSKKDKNKKLKNNINQNLEKIFNIGIILNFYFFFIS